MTDEQWAELEPLARAETAARQRVQSLGMMNQSQDPRQAMEASIAYRRAQIEAEAASKALLEAQRQMGL